MIEKDGRSECTGMVSNLSRTDEDQNGCGKLASRMELRSHTQSHTASEKQLCLFPGQQSSRTHLCLNPAEGTQRGTAEPCMHIIKYSDTTHP